MAIDLLRRYFRERLTLPVAVLILLLVATSLLVSAPAGGGDLAARVVLAFFLVLQFRLWDDLEDVARDRGNHPRRVLVNAPSLAPFHAAVGAAMAGLVLLLGLVGSWSAVIGYGALCLALKLWYHWARARCRVSWVHAGVVLLKYPVFVGLLVPAAELPTNGGRLLVTGTVLYAALCFYEWFHDIRSKTLPESL